MATTIKDVAKKAHVCVATVSRAFNSPELVSDEKKEVIFRAAEELNYQPNALAQGLITKSTKSVGILVPDINNIFHPTVIQGIENTCFSLGYLSYVCNTYNDIDRERSSIEALLKQQIDGFIFVGTRPTDPALNEHLIKLAEHSEVVLMFDDLPSRKLCAVYTDEVDGSFEAVRYLKEKGHQKIAFFTSDEPYTTFQYKRRGYEKGLNYFGLPVDEDFVFYGLPYENGGYQCMETMLSRFSEEEMPRAVFAISDQVLAGACEYCREHGIRIPEDLEVVGFSGSRILHSLGWRFPTIDQQPYEIGCVAAETLIHNIQKDRPRQRKVVCDSFLKLSW